MENLYQLVSEASEQGHSVAMATVVQVQGSTPREVGAKMLIYADGRIAGTVGGGKMEAVVIEKAIEALRQGQSQMAHFDLIEPAEGDVGICGGTADVFIDAIVPRPALLIVGGGHVAQPTAEIGAMCGFGVTVIDDREEMVAQERFPHADRRLTGDIVETLKSISIAPNTHIVIVTRGHAYDEDALRAVIDSPAAYVGMIGSRRKAATIFDHLRADGIDEARIARVHSPIGLNIGSQTPAEIAVSILAEIIMLRRGKSCPT
ncbi:MAG: XdhC family protein [Anaerolineae bacterium]|nr:XdhC family protein [Anaerolineae bacterium]